MRDEYLPVFRIGIIVGRRQNLEVLGVLVASDLEEIFAMIEEVAVLLFAGKEKGEI